MGQDVVELNKHKNQNLSQFPDLLTKQVWSIKDLFHVYLGPQVVPCISRTPSFFLFWEVLNRQDNPILPAYILGTYMLKKNLMHAFFPPGCKKGTKI